MTTDAKSVELEPWLNELRGSLQHGLLLGEWQAIRYFAERVARAYADARVAEETAELRGLLTAALTGLGKCTCGDLLHCIICDARAALEGAANE